MGRPRAKHGRNPSIMGIEGRGGLPSPSKLKKRHGDVPANLLYETMNCLRVKHGIKTIGELFEAERQLTEMEHLGEIGAVCTLDSGSLPLGCKNLKDEVGENRAHGQRRY